MSDSTEKAHVFVYCFPVLGSVIVNALRKFESAGVIESRSLGMKGTHIKILNDKLIPELKKVRNNY